MDPEGMGIPSGSVMNFLRAIYFGWKCFQFYRDTEEHSLNYFGIETFGVASTAVVFARGREAWRVSHLAIEAYRREGGTPVK